MDGDAWWYSGGGGGGGNNWDLGAVVRFGCGGGRVSPAPTTTLLGEAWEYDPFSSFLVPPMTTQQALPVCEGDDAAWMAPLHGLQTGGSCLDADDLCGAFFAAPAQQQPAVAAAEVTPPSLTQAADDAPPPAHDNTQPATDQQASGGARAGGSRSARRKKKQTTKEVVRVAANGPAPDSWAWRKYGQKPIKGSPYPRGYYRCSSNKSCAARKQVERCRVDPSFLLLTYTGAHTGHDVPLHRNSLAGTTRHKPPPLLPSATATAEAGTSMKSPATAAEAAAMASSSHSQSPGQSASPSMSPTTPLLTSPMELHGEDDAELQVEDMAIDDDDEDVADETINTVPWGTPISDAVIAASYEWR